MEYGEVAGSNQRVRVRFVMQLDLDNLPSDTTLLHRLVRDMAAVVERRDGEIERLQLIIRQLQRAQYGRRSERLDADQLALGLEDVESDLAHAEAQPKPEAKPKDAKPRRKPLPNNLPREDVVLDAAADACPCCGGTLHSIGESVSEMLDWVPARLRVIRIRRPKYGCRACGTVHQAPAPERPIAGGLATPALLAQVLVSKYCDHTPLYRQSQIFARHGVELDRSTLAGWVGGACWWLDALHERLCANVFASDHLFADDTPIPVLDPGRGRTKTGRLWVEERIRGQSRALRLAERRTFSKPLVEKLKVWFEQQLSRGPRRGKLADAIRYALVRWDGLTRFLHDGRIELDTNPVERAIRPVALGRKNHLFAGSDGGGARWATLCSLIETAKMNDVEPYAYLRDVLERMVDGHLVNRLDELLPWNWQPAESVKT
jgi:transposase